MISIYYLPEIVEIMVIVAHALIAIRTGQYELYLEGAEFFYQILMSLAQHWVALLVRHEYRCR